ncbi:MAG TPA: MATE family efflux transporter [Candidatus Nanoarchaeia archaeon]|nr:MATE family efflux transporter [Candidatus Nanoarchaeia archaeon]
MTKNNHLHKPEGENFTHDLTTGIIRKQLWSLAWPMMLSVLFYTLYNIVDAYWVSKLSPEAIAAVSISQITLFITMALGFGVTVGSGVVMAMHIGAKDTKEAERILGQSFVLAAILGIFFTIISLIFRTQLLTISGAAGLIFEPAKEYFTIIAGGSILMFLLMTIMFAFNSQGDTSTLTKLFAISTLINAILDPIMIFGWLGFPVLGISGAAIATLISQVIFIIIALRSLSGKHRSIRFHVSNLTFKWESVKRVLKIGFPAALTQVIYPIGLAVLTLITSSRFLEPGAISLSLGFRIEFFAFLPAVGFGFGAMAMIGQNIGAGNINRAREVLKTALKYGFLTAAGLGVLAALLAEPIIGVFTTDPAVTKDTLSYLRIVALLSYGFLAASMVEANSFQALGKSWPGFWIFFLRFIVITLPLSYVLTHILSYPIIAVWISVVVGSVVSAAVGYVWIRKTMKKLDLKEAPVQAH